MRISSKFLCFIIVYLINLNKWVIAESTDTLASVNPSHEEDGNQKTGGSDGALTAGEPAEGGSLATTKFKVFKDDADGNPTQIKENDFSQASYSGYLIYEFKPNVQCTLVKVEDKYVWKQGDQGVNEPISVSYNPDTHKVVVYKCQKSVFYEKDNSGNWVHYYIVDGSFTLNHTDHSSSGSKAPETISILSSTPEPREPDSSESAKASEEVDEASDKEAEEPSTVAPEATGANEVSPDAGLRGTSAPTDTKEEADETASLASGGADTSEEKEKEASADPDGTTGGLASGESSDAGLVSVSSGEAGEEGSTSGGDASLASTDASPEGSVATPANEVSTSGGSSGEGAGADAAENLTAQPAGGDADASSTHTGEDGSSQPSSGAPTSDGTDLTSVSDKSANGSPEDGGSSATPLHSSGGDGSTVDPGQDGTATQTGSPAGDSESSTKTGVELSLKSEKATNEFDYEAVDECVTFTAKDNHAFNAVKEDNTEIWKAEDEKSYAIKVVFNNKGQWKKDVTIHLLNGTKNAYKKDGLNKPWNEVEPPAEDTASTPSSTPASSATSTAGGANQGPDGTSSGGSTDQSSDGSGRTHTGGESGDGQGGVTTPPAKGGSTHTSGGSGRGGGGGGTPARQPKDTEQTSEITVTVLKPEEYPQDIKLLKADLDDENNTVVLGSNDYIVKKHGEAHLYEFESGVKCTLIKRDEKEVWKYDSSKADNKYPKGINVDTKFFSIFFEGCTVIYAKTSDGWTVCVESKINLKWAKSLRDKLEIYDVPIYFMID